MTITATIYSTGAPPEPFDPAEFPTSLKPARQLLARKPMVEGATYYICLTEEFVDDETDTPDFAKIAQWAFECHRNEPVLYLATGQETLILSQMDITESTKALLHMLKNQGARRLLLYAADETINTVYGCAPSFVPPVVSLAIPRDLADEISKIGVINSYEEVSIYI